MLIFSLIFFLVSINDSGDKIAYSIYNIGSGMYMKIVNENGEISEQKAVNNNYQIKDKLFVCGDMASGQSLVVKAMASGLECAKSVNKYLMDIE